jgi:hypothetical protein
MAGLFFALSAFGGSITSESYATAYSEGIAVIFPPSIYYPLSGPTNSSFYSTDVETFVNSTTSTTWHGCTPSAPSGNIVTGCSPTYPANYYTENTNVTTGSTSVNNTGNTESYSGTATGTPAGLNSNGSFSASVASPSAGQYGYVNTAALSSESLIVAPTVADPAGTDGSLVLTYTIYPPSVTGSAAGGNANWYGEWQFASYLPTGTTSTDDYQVQEIDLSTITGATLEQFTVPFVFGSSVIVESALDVGIGWSATGSGPLSASGSFDPVDSLTGIEVLGAGGTQLTNFSITDSDGNGFGADGLITPEPSTFLLAATGLLGLAAARRVRRKVVAQARG